MKTAATLSLLAAGIIYASTTNAAPVCGIEIHPRFNLYVVNVDGKPFKNKHYVDYDDAALLHRVLVDGGRCVPAQTVAKCDPSGNAGHARIVRLAATGPGKKRPAGAAQLSWSPGDCTAQ